MTSKPNFFIAGTAKSGTSSLFHYLNLHPDIFMSPIKEPHFFCHDSFPDEFRGPGDKGFSQNRIRTIEAYTKLFEDGKNASIRGEGSVYYMYFPEVAERIYKFNPDAKFVFILRNPVERAYSAYMHTVRDGREHLSFEQALKAEESRRKRGYQPLWWFKEIGMYSAQIERYLNVFPIDQIKIFLYEELLDIQKVVQQTLAFLCLNQHVNIDTSIKYNTSGVPKSRKLYRFFAEPHPVKEFLKPFLPKSVRHKLGQKAKAMTLCKATMAPETRELLQREFKADIQRLESLIGKDLTAWTSI